MLHPPLSFVTPCLIGSLSGVPRRDLPWPSGYDAWLPSVSSQVESPRDAQKRVGLITI